VNREQRTQAYNAVERATELPMLALAVLLIPLLVIPLVTTVPDPWDDVILTLDWAIWAAFAAELLIKTYLAPSRWRYLRAHWFDVLIVALPFVRPLRAVRVLRLLRLVGVGAKVRASLVAVFGRHGAPAALTIALGVIIAATVAVTYVERDAGGTIDNLGTALWWAITTVTTVGYGDVTPVTPQGRGIAVLVMIVGVSLFGLLTANAASFFVDTDRRHEPEMLRELVEHVKRLEAEVAALRRDLLADGAANEADETVELMQPTIIEL
jgi:voltage-gated potassium channel